MHDPVAEKTGVYTIHPFSSRTTDCYKLSFEQRITYVMFTTIGTKLNDLVLIILSKGI